MKIYVSLLLCCFGIACCANSQPDKLSFSNLPLLNPSYSPLDERNKAALFNRLVTAFDQYYQNNFDSSHNIATGDQEFYYFRQELQAIIDMYYATKKSYYLKNAKELVFKAISDAQSNPRPFIYQQTTRGQWPCFLLKSVISATGGHSQLNDFQGAAGFMMVASALKKENISGWKEISDFVEKKIIEKWLFHGNPTFNISRYTGNQSNIHLLAALDGSRDKREHFACICLNLSELGYRKYPYRDWAQFLFNIYLTEKTSIDEPYPDVLYRSKVPTDWGLYHQKNGTLIWSWGGSDLVNYGTLDTSHANRTIWAACQALEKGMLPKKTTLNNLIVSFKKNIWVTKKGPFYFNNSIDGTDPYKPGMGPGRRGNIWFGWHRLAAYDNDIRKLFISIAYDITNGGPNIPYQAQNKAMKEAPLCLIAWATRLISPNGSPTMFP